MPAKRTNPTVRGLIAQVSWLGAANVAVKPVWFAFITALCMRLLGVEGYGVFSAAIALSMMAMSLTDLGMVRFTAREIARDRSRASLLVTNLYPAKLLSLLLSAAVAVGVAIVLDYRREALMAVLFASCYAVALQLTQYCRAVFEGFEQLTTEAAMLVLEKVMVVGCGLAGLLTTREPHWTLAGMAIGMMLAAAAHTVWIERRLAPIRRALFGWDYLKGALRAMIPIGLGGMFIGLYYRVDLVMIESMLGEASAGQYGVAYRILEALNMIIVVILAGLYPRLSSLGHEKNEREFRSIFARGQAALLLLSIGTALTLTVFSPVIVALLSGDSGFEASVGVLRILVWAFPLLCANSLLYSALLAIRDERFTAWMVGGAVVLNVGLNWWMIPAYGINGAAVATIVPEVVILMVYSLRFRTVRRQAFM